MGEALTPAEAAERIGRLLQVETGRAVVAVCQVAPGTDLDAAIASLGLGDALRRVDVAGASVANRERDLLLRTHRLVLAVAGSAAELRLLRQRAPDLLASADLVALVVDGGPGAPWAVVAARLCALAVERHARLDLSGVLPAGDVPKVPLADLYLDLARFEAPGRAPVGWLVLAHPGAGKTTLLRHLALVAASGEPVLGGRFVPVLAPLSEWARARATDRAWSLRDWLPDWLAEQGVVGDLALDQTILLLDGLDEVREPAARRALLHEVGRLAETGAVGRVVVTGRSFLVDELRAADARLHMARLEAPDDDQIARFVRIFLTAQDRKAETGRVLRRLAEDPDVAALARSPLVLTLLCALHVAEGRLPDRRVELYWRLGEMLVDRWARARRVAGGVGVRTDRGQALRVLGPMAWWIVERGGGVVAEDELLDEIGRIEARWDDPSEARDRARALLDLLRVDTALLVPEPPRRWRFVHPSVAEYFAGVEACRDRARWTAVLQDPYRPEWREIVLFAAGVLGSIEGRMIELDALVAAVLDKGRRSGRYHARYPGLLCGLVNEDPGFTRRQLRSLVDRLLEHAFTSAFLPHGAFRVQEELVGLVGRVQGRPAEAVLAEALRAWFRPEPTGVQWDRVLEGALYDDADLDHLRFPSLAAAGRVTLLAGALPSLLTAAGIDPAPTLRAWQAHADRRLRLAGWAAALASGSVGRDAIPEPERARLGDLA